MPAKYQKTLARYKRLHPKAGGKRRGKVDIASFVSVQRQEQQLLKDGVIQMMCERGYIAHKGKPKNGAIDAITAAADFWEMRKDPEELQDDGGIAESEMKPSKSTELVFIRKH